MLNPHPIRVALLAYFFLLLFCPANPAIAQPLPGTLIVGAAAAEIEADDSMVIAGGIGPGKAVGQEGKLRAVATLLELDGVRLGLVACDVLMISRSSLDPVVRQIEEKLGIPSSNVMINCTHTHHAPSTCKIHGYDADPVFIGRVQRAIFDSLHRASSNMVPCRFSFALGQENGVGQNSRLLLDDGLIYWIGPRQNVVRPTGPFDPDLPLLAFRDHSDALRALIFNHSTHTIGTRTPGKRSPSIYGMAAQELESEFGGTITFLQGASGSTHNLELSGDECISRIKDSVRLTFKKVEGRPVRKLAALKRPFTFRIRHFNEKEEEAAVERYCRKYAPAGADSIIKVFRDMRRELAPVQGHQRETWLQVLRVGDVAIAAVPAEYFTQLGLDIKNRSPFRHTYVAELANDWIGYLPNLEGHKLGGYQVWTGFHSYAEPGTGERVADEIVRMLHEVR